VAAGEAEVYLHFCRTIPNPNLAASLLRSKRQAMKMNVNLEANADQASHTYRGTNVQIEGLALDTPVPEVRGALAETTVTQAREAYERSITTLQAGLEALQRSFNAVGHTSALLNRKVIDIAQCNANSSFDLVKSLAAAKNLAEILELHTAYWRKQFGLLMAQAEEVNALQVSGREPEPVKQYTTHQAGGSPPAVGAVEGDQAANGTFRGELRKAS